MPKNSIPKAPALSEDIETTTTPSLKRARRSFTPAPDDPAIAAAEKQREDAFHAVHQWRGKTLLPFSISRESLFFRLRAADDAPTIAQVMQTPMAWLQDAIRILFLCSHEPEDFAHLRGNNSAFLKSIDQWAEGDNSWKSPTENGKRKTENASPISRDEQVPVIKLTLRIFNESDSTRAEIAPSDNHSDLGE